MKICLSAKPCSVWRRPAMLILYSFVYPVKEIRRRAREENHFSGLSGSAHLRSAAPGPGASSALAARGDAARVGGNRAARPFACRIFPLTPVKGEKGWTVRMDARARGLCPLYRHGARGLNPDFARAAVRAIRLIASDPEGEEFLNRWAALEKEYRLPF